ncbi:hypothetical protein EDI_289490 [Entamoeba dispar SAW760]|uniref:Uncharacterized protein n=1 Tax=Entamoeba dispar (strain ATCC PRA-260 / SAW760) TaxID=370354 RepID=B0EVA3_ENTDS|nr:uncharacterized protein EDI_289490 [Entamoeba dispar SAW760]EDR21515.1 hypothetical protein EDI_289490 [Entamoeba dispar SAW760]|eukprot:EDR21515.1 hypothetical protein EDI_289490 [Entamoeba dispar SAW760]
MDKTNIFKELGKPRKKGFGSRDGQLLIQKERTEGLSDDEKNEMKEQEKNKQEESDDSVLFVDDDEVLNKKPEESIVFNEQEDDEVFFDDDDKIIPCDNLKAVECKLRSERMKEKTNFLLTEESQIIRNKFIQYLYDEYYQDRMIPFNELVKVLIKQIDGCLKGIQEYCVNIISIVGMTTTNYDYMSSIRTTLLSYGRLWHDISIEDTFESSDTIVIIIELPEQEKCIETIWRVAESLRKKLIVFLVGNTIVECDRYLLGHDYPMIKIATISTSTTQIINHFEYMQLKETIIGKLPLIHPSIISYNIMLYRDFHHSYKLFIQFIIRHIEHSVIFTNPSLIIPQFLEGMSEADEKIKLGIEQTYDFLSVIFTRLLFSIQTLSQIHFHKLLPPYTSLLNISDIAQPLFNFNFPSNFNKINIPEDADDELKNIINTINSSPSSETFKLLLDYISITIGIIKTFQTNYQSKIECCCVSTKIDFNSFSLFDIIRHCEEGKPKAQQIFTNYRIILNNVNRKGIISVENCLSLFPDKSPDEVKTLIKELITFGLFVPHNDELRSTEIVITSSINE